MPTIREVYAFEQSALDCSGTSSMLRGLAEIGRAQAPDVGNGTATTVRSYEELLGEHTAWTHGHLELPDGQLELTIVVGLVRLV